jgi:hypothetical protein
MSEEAAAEAAQRLSRCGAVPSRVLADPGSGARRLSHSGRADVGRPARDHADGGGLPGRGDLRLGYEITPEGLKPTVEVPHGQSNRKLRNTRITGACYDSCCRCDRSSAARELGEPHASSAWGGPP